MNNELLEMIAEVLEVDVSDLTSDVNLEDLEAWDSVAVLSILVILSDETGVQVNPCDMSDLKTFGDIETLVSEKLLNKPS